MKSKSLFTISSMLLVMLLAISFVAASIDVNTYTASRDFSVTSAYGEVSICSCSTKYDSISVTNTGTWPAIFTVSANDITSKLTFSENSFELNSGQSKEVFLYISADCSKGTDNLKLTVTSNLGPQKTLVKKIVRDRCQNIEMWATNYTREINPCQSKNIEINVHNVGPFADTYYIDSNYDKYITYNAQSFNLEPNQYAKITATVKFDCGMYGQKDIVFKANSQKNKLTATLNAPLTIARNYDYDFSVNDKYNIEGMNTVGMQICNRMQYAKIPIVVKNKGTVPNHYDVKFDNLPRSASVEELIDGTFSLNPGETKVFYVNIDSTSYRHQHKFKDFTVKITPELGDIVKETKVSLEFMPCYEHEIIIYDYGNSKNRPLRTCEDYDYSYDINIVNKGIFKETFYLTLEDAPSTVRLSKMTTELSPGDNEVIKLLITGPADNENHKILLKVVSGKGIVEYGQDIWIKAYDTQSCHNTLMGKDTYKINYQTSSITVPIKNKGLVDNTFLTSWDGSKIVDDNVNLISINKSQTEKLVLNVKSYEKKEGTYDGTLTLKDASGAVYSKEISLELKDKSMVRKAFEYLAFGNVCRQVSLYQVAAIFLIIILIIVFLIKGPHYPYSFWNRVKSKTSLIIFLSALFLIGLVMVISIAGLPKTHTEAYNLTINSSELTYEWLQDGKYTLDVSGFFYDPENSTLNYEVKGLENIKAVISGKTITFYSDLGWSGTEHAKIIATDNMGGSVTSPAFTLRVRDIPKKTYTEMFNIYCWYFNLLIFAALLLFVFVAVFVKQKRRTRK